MERSRDFRDAILESDVIIYDLMTNDFKEVDYVIKTLKTSKLTSKKTLIILSSVLTWVNTLPKLQKEGEEQEGEGAEGEEGAGEEEEAEEEEPDSDDVPAEDGAEEEEGKPKKPKVLFFKETDNHLRVPHERFLPHKNLETLAMSAPKTQPMLKVHILCAYHFHFLTRSISASACASYTSHGSHQYGSERRNQLNWTAVGTEP